MAKGDRGSRGRSEYGRTERDRGQERRDKEQRSQDRRDSNERAREAQEAPKQEDKGIMDSISDWASDAWQGAKDWATGKEDTGGFSPMGGAASYGMSKKQFDSSIGKRRHEARNLGQRLGREVDYFQEAPMDYASDLLDNPLVSGAALMTGLGLPAFGVKAVDAIMDVYQNEEDPLGALANVGAGALSFTPVGKALPTPVRSIAKAGLKAGPKAAAKAAAGVAGGKIGTGMGASLAEAFTDNPYARAGITAGAAGAAAWGGSKLASTAMAQPTQTQGQPRAPRESHRGDSSRTSPLVSSGEKAIQASEKLMQPADTGLYARTVQQLPYYGITPQQQQTPYYGV